MIQEEDFMSKEPITFSVTIEVMHVALAKYDLAAHGARVDLNDPRLRTSAKYETFKDKNYPDYFLPVIIATIRNMSDRDFKLTGTGAVNATGQITLTSGFTVEEIALRTFASPEPACATVRAGEKVKQMLAPHFALGVIRAINEGTLNGFELEIDGEKLSMPISELPDMVKYCKEIVGEDYDKIRKNIEKFSK